MYSALLPKQSTVTRSSIHNADGLMVELLEPT